MGKNSIIYPFPMTETEIMKDNLEEYNNYITQKNKKKEQFKIAKHLILDSKKRSDNLLDIWEEEVKTQNINDNYQNIKKIIYYESDTNNTLGIHFNDDVAKYFIDNYRLDINYNSFLFSLYPNSFQNKTPFHIVIVTEKNIYFTNNNYDSPNMFNVISL